jgi:glycine hydroxymethyltransferase
MALSLNEGGHLTHGAPVNFSGKWFVPAPYGLNPKTHLIDMDEVRRVALASRPKMIIAGLTAYPRALDFAAFRAIADEVGAYLMVDMAHIAGLVATGLHASPFPHAHVATSTTHKTLRGPRGGIVLTNDDALNKKVRMAVFPGLQGGPLMHVIAAKAVAFGQALSPTFQGYMKRVVANARALGEALQREGLDLLTGGTDNHMVLVDLRSLGISGQMAEAVLEAFGLICNKNTVPGETRPPRAASGLRLGTPAVTTRGLNEDDCRAVGGWIATLLKHKARGDEATVLPALAAKVAALARAHPLPY